MEETRIRGVNCTKLLGEKKLFLLSWKGLDDTRLSGGKRLFLLKKKLTLF